jgi:hypothetical protein
LIKLGDGNNDKQAYDHSHDISKKIKRIVGINLANELKIIKKNINLVIGERYSTFAENIDTYMVDVLLANKACHLTSCFKDHMILDYNEEFLKR